MESSGSRSGPVWKTELQAVSSDVTLCGGTGGGAASRGVGSQDLSCFHPIVGGGKGRHSVTRVWMPECPAGAGDRLWVEGCASQDSRLQRELLAVHAHHYLSLASSAFSLLAERIGKCYLHEEVACDSKRAQMAMVEDKQARNQYPSQPT